MSKYKNSVGTGDCSGFVSDSWFVSGSFGDIQAKYHEDRREVAPSEEEFGMLVYHPRTASLM